MEDAHLPTDLTSGGPRSPKTSDCQPQTLPTGSLTPNSHAGALGSRRPHQVPPQRAGSYTRTAQGAAALPWSLCHCLGASRPEYLRGESLDNYRVGHTGHLVGRVSALCVYEGAAGPRQTFRINLKCHFCTAGTCLTHLLILLSSLKHRAVTAPPGAEGHPPPSPAGQPVPWALPAHGSVSRSGAPQQTARFCDDYRPPGGPAGGPGCLFSSKLVPWHLSPHCFELSSH